MCKKTFNQSHISIGNILEDVAMQDFSVLVLVVHTALIKALRKQRQADLCGSEVNLVYKTSQLHRETLSRIKLFSTSACVCMSACMCVWLS